MSGIFELQAQLRKDVGKGASRRLRRISHLVPGIIYGAGKEPVNLSFLENELNKALKHEAFYSHILTINIEGKTESAVLKAIHRHPSKPYILHLDLMRIKSDEAIIMRVPFHFTGEDVAPGIKNSGGAVSHLLNDVEIKCLPKDLPEFITVDISKLELDEAIHLSELKLPKGVEIPALAQGPEHDLSIVNVHKQKVQAIEEETPAAEATEEKSAAEKSDTDKKEEK